MLGRTHLRICPPHTAEKPGISRFLVCFAAFSQTFQPSCAVFGCGTSLSGRGRGKARDRSSGGGRGQKIEVWVSCSGPGAPRKWQKEGPKLARGWLSFTTKSRRYQLQKATNLGVCGHWGEMLHQIVDHSNLVSSIPGSFGFCKRVRGCHVICAGFLDACQPWGALTTSSVALKPKGHLTFVCGGSIWSQPQAVGPLEMLQLLFFARNPRVNAA